MTKQRAGPGWDVATICGRPLSWGHRMFVGFGDIHGTRLSWHCGISLSWSLLHSTMVGAEVTGIPWAHHHLMAELDPSTVVPPTSCRGFCLYVHTICGC